MSQLVDTGNGVAEFPDEMSHDEIAGVIKKQFYSLDNPPPAEIKPGTSAKAENVIAGMDQSPAYPSKADATQGVVENLANAAGEIVEGIPGFVAQAPQFALQGTKLAQGTLSEKLSALSFLGSQAVPMGKQMASDIEAPIGSKESFRGFLQAGLMAAPGLELAREIRAGSLQAQLAPITGEVPKIEAPPVQEVLQTPTEAVIPKSEPVLEAEKAAAKPETLTPQEEVTPQGLAASSEISRESQFVPEVSQAPVKSGLQAKPEGWTDERWEIFKRQTQDAKDVAAKREAEYQRLNLPELPENTEVTIKASTSKGEPLEVKMDAREAEKVLNERKTAFENLIDCLG